MFDGSLPEVDDLAAVDDAALVDAIKRWSRAESAASARKLAAAAELFCRRTGLDNAQDRWIDPNGAVSVELGAALGTSRGLALAQAHRGVALRDRLPQVAELFAAGEITDLLVRAIVWRTHLIEDSEALAAVDEELAARVRRWGALTVTKTEQAIDAIVLDHDASALRRTSAAIRKRDVQFGSPPTSPASPACGPDFMPTTAPCFSSGSTKWFGRCVPTTHAPWPTGAPTRWRFSALEPTYPAAAATQRARPASRAMQRATSLSMWWPTNRPSKPPPQPPHRKDAGRQRLS